MSSAERRAAAVVDLTTVRRNCVRLADSLSGTARLCAVVKADGYGHGAVECAGAALAGGASWLAVGGRGGGRRDSRGVPRCPAAHAWGP